MISEKYIAGLIDSDGYFGYKEVKLKYKPQLHIVIAQKKIHSRILEELYKQCGGTLRDVKNKIGGDTVYTYWTLYSKDAKMLLNRIQKYLVIKKDHCKRVLEMAEENVFDIDETKRKFKESRQTKTDPLPNYPTRKWLAGYFDGDGCVSTDTKIYKNGNVGIFATIGTHKSDAAGLEIIQKNFGGSLLEMHNKTCMKWTLCDRGKLKVFFEYFAKYSSIKRDQIYKVLQYLDTDQRNGSLLKQDLKMLKRDPQRLNEETATAEAIVQQV